MSPHQRQVNMLDICCKSNVMKVINPSDDETGLFPDDKAPSVVKT